MNDSDNDALALEGRGNCGGGAHKNALSRARRAERKLPANASEAKKRAAREKAVGNYEVAKTKGKPGKKSNKRPKA